MEVHHPHHSTHKKDWKEYITEFIMLFAAVSLGFLAENVREQYIEKERAHELISRFEVDVKNNVYFLDSLLTFNHNMEYQMDTALIELFHSKDAFDLNFFFANVKPAFPRFLSKNDTYEQMKSSGSLRYIKDETLLTMMTDYTNETEGTEYRSKEQEASYVLGEYANILNKWIPAEIAVRSHVKSFSNMKARVQSPDSTIQLMSKMEYLSDEKPHIIRGQELAAFKKEIIPAMTRRMALMKTTMSYLKKSSQEGETLLRYLEIKH